MSSIVTPVGLDLSLTSTGLSVGAASVAIQSKKKGCERLVEIRNRVVQEVLSHPLPIVLVEGYSFSSRNSHAHALGELGGVVRVALHENGVPYVDVPPNCLKKFATGKGNASKAQVVSAISARTGVVFDTDDEADAWVLAEIGRVHYLQAGVVDWPKSHLQALEKVAWPSIPLAHVFAMAEA